ncbi:MAG: rod shape-determining protein MreD [Phycisphaerales bacterium]|nr:MAG: rod shape-determining protein MreD [Phycisphaerales bacterium]
MRWLTFVVCAVVVVTLQVTVAHRLEWYGAQPQWILVLAVFFALNGRSVDVLIGVWILGAVADLHTMARFGLLSLSYGLTGAVVYRAREYLYREHPVTQFCVTFIVCLLIEFGLSIYRISSTGAAPGAVSVMARQPLFVSLYTALWAVPIHLVLLRFHRALGIMPARMRGRRPRFGQLRNSTHR